MIVIVEISSYVDNCFVVEATQIDAVVDTDARQLT